MKRVADVCFVDVGPLAGYPSAMAALEHGRTCTTGSDGEWSFGVRKLRNSLRFIPAPWCDGVQSRGAMVQGDGH